MELPFCVHCDTKIRPFRKRLDFNGRVYHYKCWKLCEDKKLYKMILDDFLSQN